MFAGEAFQDRPGLLVSGLGRAGAADLLIDVRQVVVAARELVLIGDDARVQGGETFEDLPGAVERGPGLDLAADAVIEEPQGGEGARAFRRTGVAVPLEPLQHPCGFLVGVFGLVRSARALVQAG